MTIQWYGRGKKVPSVDDAVHLLRSGLVIESVELIRRVCTVLYLALTCGDGQSIPSKKMKITALLTSPYHVRVAVLVVHRSSDSTTPRI